MKANELRIGNLIHRKDIGDNHIRTESILEISNRLMCSGPAKVVCTFDEVEPIPLTEEWLLKFGFQLLTEKRAGTKYSEYGNGEIHHEKRFNLAKHADKNYWYCLRGSVKIQFVHQLQNLYFALTGSELSTDHCKLPTE